MTENAPDNAPPQAAALPIPSDSGRSSLALDTGGRDMETGRFVAGNKLGPGRPMGRKDRINSILEGVREAYGADTQADALRLFAAETVRMVRETDNIQNRLELLRLLKPAELSQDVEIAPAVEVNQAKVLEATVRFAKRLQEAGID